MTQEGFKNELKEIFVSVLEEQLVPVRRDIEYLKENMANMATKTSVDALKEYMNREFAGVRYKMTDMQTSINTIDEKVDRLHVDIARLNKRDEEDTQALGRDVYVLKKRVSKLENKA